MTQITPELLNAVMAKQGAPNTTDNLNRIAEFAAVHPEMLEQYIGKGTDQSAVGSSIDRSIATTDSGPKAPNSAVNTLQANQVASRGLADPNGYISTVDPNTGMSNIGPRLTKTPEPTGGGRRAPGPPNAGRRGTSAVNVDPNLVVPDATKPGDDGLGIPWWLALLPAYRGKPTPQLPPPFVQEPRGGLPAHMQPRGVTATGPTAEYGGRMPPSGGVTDVNDLNARNIPQQSQGALPPQIDPRGDPRAARTPIQGQPPQITGSDVPTYPSGGPEITKGNIYDATKGEVQRQVDAENERLLKEEMAKRNARPVRPARPGIR